MKRRLFSVRWFSLTSLFYTMLLTFYASVCSFISLALLTHNGLSSENGNVERNMKDGFVHFTTNPQRLLNWTNTFKLQALAPPSAVPMVKNNGQIEKNVSIFDEHEKNNFSNLQNRLTSNPVPPRPKLSQTREPVNNFAGNDYFREWKMKVVSDCGGNFIGYGSYFVHFKNLLLNKTLAHAGAKGGEPITNVLHQNSDEENYELRQGFQKLRCSKRPTFTFETKIEHLHIWWKTTVFSDKEDVPQWIAQGAVMDKKFTLMLTRYEYANVYWTVIDLYNAFLMTRFFAQSVEDVQVVLVDAKPHTSLDELWTTIFNASRLSSLPLQTVFSDLVWIFGRGESPLLVQSPAVPLVSEFRQAVLSRFKIPHEHHRDCSHLNILFIWRRNYVAHPRNPSGVVSRKIKNEDELLNATRRAFKNTAYNITGVQLDSLGVSAQLQLLSKTDIMIGMHGAAFGFSLLLPKGGGIIELYPKGPAKNWHMEYLAKWNKLHYSTWSNKNGRLEDFVNKYTTVPPDIVLTLLNKMIQNICQ